MTILDLCAYLGLGAVGATTVNLLIGLLMALRYSPVRNWPHRGFNLFALHQWTAYAAVALTLTHPLILLFVKRPHFRLYDVVWPVDSPQQPSLNLVGACALYLLLLVFLSSLLRTRIGRPIWRKLHYLVFPAAILLFVHSIFTDPALQNSHPDLLDGGKIFVEASALVSVGAVALRIRLSGRGFRPVSTPQTANLSVADHISE